MIDITEHHFISDKICREINVLLLTDIHGKSNPGIIRRIKDISPDIIAIAGDFANVEREYAVKSKAYDPRAYLEIDSNPIWITDPWTIRKYNMGLLEFLCELSDIAPTFLSLGNHEWALQEEDFSEIKKNGITILDNSYEKLDAGVGVFYIGGLTSAEVMLIRGFVRCHGHPRFKQRHDSFEHTDALEMKWMDEFREKKGLKLLLCHHPEYLLGDDPAVNLKGVDLALSGHAHGGQIRYGHRGLYAPGQGFFPAYTEGLIEKNGAKVIISRGIANTYLIPRINNHPEIISIKILPNIH